MRERVIETTQITKKYGKVLALDHVDICVKRGDIYGLIGDNGAGKSTLLKLWQGIVRHPQERSGCLENRERRSCKGRDGAVE